eukprot:1146266-Pyramimonas_sp.AAC.1
MHQGAVHSDAHSESLADAMRKRKTPEDAANHGSLKGAFQVVDDAVEVEIQKLNDAEREAQTTKIVDAAAIEKAKADAAEPGEEDPIDKAIVILRSTGLDAEALGRVRTSLSSDDVDRVAKKQDEAWRLTRTFVTLIVEAKSEEAMYQALSETA